MAASKTAKGLSDLEDLSRSELAALWEAVVKRPTPKAASHIFLLKALSYEL